jgi:short-subunit dehydrogenase
MLKKNKTRQLALVTGASSGIGAAFAERLAQDGYDLIIAARRGDRLEALAQRLQKSEGVTIEAIAADLTDHSALRMLEQRIIKDLTLALLVNNAGFGGYMPFVSLDPDKAEELINLQVLAVTRLTRAALPGMVARGHGAIINVSSRLAFSASLDLPHLPKRATYAATKAYINTFTQILHSELKGTGVRVQALCPGIVRTEFHQRMVMDPAQLPAAMVMNPEEIVQASLRGLQLGEVICIPALEDRGLLDEVNDSIRRLLERSNGGKLAKRYSA